MPQSVAPPYCGLISDGNWMSYWNLDPVPMLAVAALGHLALRAPPSRRPWAGVAFACALVLWMSPFCPWSATLLSVRTAHHMAVMLVLAPALALAWPRLRTGTPVLWAVVSIVVLVAWFIPLVYSFAWNSAAAYWVLQLLMLGAAWQFWASWFAPESAGRPIMFPAAPALLAMAMGMVGALLTFAPRPLLSEHILTSALVGAVPLHDQQLAGLVMWTVGMIPMAVYAAYGLVRQFRGAMPAASG